MRHWLLAFLLPACAGGFAQADQDREDEALSAAGIAGEILDTAVEHCRRGESAQALSLFLAMRAQLEPPPAILRLIQDLEATGCHRRQAAARQGGLRVQLGAGWDSNVSQGITANRLVIGSGANAIELALDESYRPRSSPFTQASVDYTLVLPGSGLNLQGSVGHRKNTRESAFDLSTASAAVSREFKVRDSIVRAEFDLAEIWLGPRHYQRTRGGGLRWLRATSAGTWLATLNAVKVVYLTQPAQNALQHDVGLLLERRLNAATSVSGGLSLQHDKANDGRPGGDRRGFQVQAGALFLASGWRFRPQLSYSRWSSEDVFAPGLIDVPRRNALSQAVLQAEKPLSAQSSLVFEWRGRRARDTVVLYGYKAQAFTTTLVHRF